MIDKPPKPIPEYADVTIAHWGRSGDGVAVHNGENIFVPFTLPAEELRVSLHRFKKMPVQGKIQNIIKASAARVAPACQHFGTCGGCGLQHVAAQAYHDYKLGLVQHELARAGVVPDAWGAMQSSPPASRRRVVYSAKKFKDGTLSVGFNERGAHWLVDVKHCAVVKPAISALLQPLRDVLQQILQPSDKVDIAVTAFPQGLDVLLLGLPRLDAHGRAALIEMAKHNQVARLGIRSQKVKEKAPLYQAEKPARIFGQLTVYPPAGAFLQATDEGEAAMAALVREAIATYQPQAKDLLDLFAGCGTFSGVLAQHGRTLAVEFAGESLDALTAARTPNISTRAQDLCAEPMSVPELNVYEVVLFDPPRAGAKEQAALLAQSKVPLVIGISCNAESFARDANLLLAGGYRLRSLTPVDQFLWSPHIEVVGVFTKEK